MPWPPPSVPAPDPLPGGMQTQVSPRLRFTIDNGGVGGSASGRKEGGAGARARARCPDRSICAKRLRPYPGKDEHDASTFVRPENSRLRPPSHSPAVTEKSMMKLCTFLYVMSTVAVTTNAALLAFTSRLFVGEESVIDDASLSTRIWIFVLFEHAILIIRSGLEALIPDEPEDIRIQLRRSEILQQCVIRLEADDDGVDFDDINSEMSEVDFKGGKY